MLGSGICASANAIGWLWERLVKGKLRARVRLWHGDCRLRPTRRATDASHVRNALARFDQVAGVSDADRAQAVAPITKAAKHYGVDMEESSWKDLENGRTPAIRRNTDVSH
jgi:hypothetical protein